MLEREKIKIIPTERDTLAEYMCIYGGLDSGVLGSLLEVIQWKHEVWDKETFNNHAFSHLSPTTTSSLCWEILL